MIYLTFFFFFVSASTGIAPCVGTVRTVQTPTLDEALLSCSRAGADLGPYIVKAFYGPRSPTI